MILEAFAVRDNAVETFLPPFFCRHRGEALRSFGDAIGDANHQFAKHKSDFVLYAIGSWDDHSGLFQAQEPVRLVSGNEIAGSAGPLQ